MTSANPARPTGTPLVTVGIPTHNALDTVAVTVQRLVAQTHSHLEILISDNASTDGTRDRIEDLRRDDDRIRVVHQPVNLGAQANFRLLLKRARGEFFMWAGADDWHHEDFILSTLTALKEAPEMSGCVSHVRWSHHGELGALAAGTRPLTGTPRQNLAEYLKTARDNSRFYGLFRRNVLLASFPESDFYGFDIATMAASLRFGGHSRIERELMWRQRTDPRSYVRVSQEGETSALDRLLPFGRVSWYILTHNIPHLSASSVLWLLWRNLYEHSRLWAESQTPYGSLARGSLGLFEKVRGAMLEVGRREPVRYGVDTHQPRQKPEDDR